MVTGALAGFVARYPDISLELGPQITEGESTCVGWTEVGTEAASGSPVEFQFLGTMRFKDGLIAEVQRFGGKRA